MAEAPPQTGTGKTVCVTGASGYIASHIVKQLLERGYTVRGTVRNADDRAKYGWLKSLEEGTSGKLELFTADLLVEGSYDRAVEGCELVCHTAAVVQFGSKDPKKDIVDPSVDGTRNVFNSVLKAQTAKRVVVTSSVSAVLNYFQERGKTFTEEDWHQELTLKSPYDMAKTLAEKLAWKMCQDQKAKGGWSFELVSICPGLVMGDVLNVQHASSAGLKTITQLMDGTLPMAPDFYFSLIHVRDVALAHVLGLEKPEASGRYLVTEAGTHSLIDMARVIKTEYPDARVPTVTMPTALLYVASLVTPMLSLDMARRMAGTVSYFSNRRVTSELGLTLIPPEQAILDSAKYLIEQGLVSKPEPAPPRAAFVLPPALNPFKKEGPTKPTEGAEVKNDGPAQDKPSEAQPQPS